MSMDRKSIESQYNVRDSMRHKLAITADLESRKAELLAGSAPVSKFELQAIESELKSRDSK